MSGLRDFDYGQLLLNRKKLEGADLTYEELRENSAAVITPKDVVNTDDWVVSEISRLRLASHIIIDSHALTREAYGFRAIAFSQRHLQDLKLDGVLILRCDPDVLIARVSSDPRGRRDMTIELAREIQTLQAALGLNYGVACGCPVFVIDTTVLSTNQVAVTAFDLLAGLGLGAK